MAGAITASKRQQQLSVMVLPFLLLDLSALTIICRTCQQRSIISPLILRGQSYNLEYDPGLLSVLEPLILQVYMTNVSVPLLSRLVGSDVAPSGQTVEVVSVPFDKPEFTEADSDCYQRMTNLTLLSSFLITLHKMSHSKIAESL